MIAYYNLLDLLNRKGMTKEELRKAIKASPTTIASISKSEPVVMKVIKDICNFLGCQPGDIMEMEREVDNTSLLYQLREEKRIHLKGGIYH